MKNVAPENAEEKLAWNRSFRVTSIWITTGKAARSKERTASPVLVDFEIDAEHTEKEIGVLADVDYSTVVRVGFGRINFDCNNVALLTT